MSTSPGYTVKIMRALDGWVVVGGSVKCIIFPDVYPSGCGRSAREAAAESLAEAIKYAFPSLQAVPGHPGLIMTVGELRER